MATKTFEELKQMAIQIRDEKANKQNTATRIGTQMLEHLNKLEQEYYDKTTLDKRVTELNISELFPTDGVDGSNKYTLAGAIAQVPAEYRNIQGLKVSFVNESGDTESWEYNGGSWTVGSFSEVGARKFSELSDNIINSKSGIYRDIVGSQNFKIKKEDMINGGIISQDGSFNINSNYLGQRYSYKFSVEIWKNGELSYNNMFWGDANQKAIAFYSSTEATADSFILGESSGSGTIRTIKIPENAITCIVCYGSKVSEEEIISLKITGESLVENLIKENNSDFDNKILNLERKIKGGYSYLIDGYIAKKQISSDGTIINANNNPTHYVSPKQLISPEFIGGTLKFYRTNYGNTNIKSLAFYDNEDNLLVSYSSGSPSYVEVIIPENSAYFYHGANIPDILSYTEKTTLKAPISSDTLFTNAEKVGRNSVNDYMLPLGVMDNLIQDAESKDYLGRVGRANVYLKDIDGMVYGVRKDTNIHEGQDYPIDTTACLKIKKNGNPNRTIVVRKTNGQEVSFTENTLPSDLIWHDFNPGKIIRNDQDWIWLYLSKVAGSCTIISYSDSDKSDYEELVIDIDRSFVIQGDIPAENLDFDRKYYTRAEKNGSKLIGKTAIVFSDSLAYFTDALYYDWGLNMITISWGGARMGYEGGAGAGGEQGTANQLWLCNDEAVQSFKERNLEKADFIICTAGTNGSLPDTDKTEVEFVLKNKRWFHDTLETNPWESLEDNDKNRFTSTACTYAAFYSMCAKYKGACAVIVEPYRTPGSGRLSNPLTPEKYAEYVFNGNMITNQDNLKKIARNIGAIFVESRTRDSIAAAEAYHENDGVHPSFVVAQDMAANIGRDLSMIFNILVE